MDKREIKQQLFFRGATDYGIIDVSKRLCEFFIFLKECGISSSFQRRNLIEKPWIETHEISLIQTHDISLTQTRGISCVTTCEISLIQTHEISCIITREIPQRFHQ